MCGDVFKHIKVEVFTGCARWNGSRARLVGEYTFSLGDLKSKGQTVSLKIPKDSLVKIADKPGGKLFLKAEFLRDEKYSTTEKIEKTTLKVEVVVDLNKA